MSSVDDSHSDVHLERLADIGPLVVKALEAFQDTHPPYGLVADGKAVTDFAPKIIGDYQVPGERGSIFGSIVTWESPYLANPYDVLGISMYATWGHWLNREGYGGVEVNAATHIGAAFGFRVAAGIVSKTARAFHRAGLDKPKPADLMACIERSGKTPARFASMDNDRARVMEAAYGLSNFVTPQELRDRFNIRKQVPFILDPEASEPTLIPARFDETLATVQKVVGSKPKRCPMVMSRVDDILSLVLVTNRAAAIAAQAPELVPNDINNWWPAAS